MNRDPGLSHLKIYELEHNLGEKGIVPPARLTFPRTEPFEGSSLTRLMAGLIGVTPALPRGSDGLTFTLGLRRRQRTIKPPPKSLTMMHKPVSPFFYVLTDWSSPRRSWLGLWRRGGRWLSYDHRFDS
jgi:hypothetical protein